MNKDKQICCCITCNEARVRGMSLGVKLAKENLCPLGILAIGSFLQAFAQEQISQQVLFANLGKSGKITDDALDAFQSVMESIQSVIEAAMRDAVSDETMIRAAFYEHAKGTPDGFDIEEYIAGMQNAAKEAAKADPVAEILAMLLNGASKRH